MSAPAPLPEGFAVGHRSDRIGRTGCTVVLPPPEEGTAGVFVTGGGPGTRETDSLSPLSRAEGCSAVLL
nr:P1 family peptidase [Solirubrobacterales bacterium]